MGRLKKITNLGKSCQFGTTSYAQIVCQLGTTFTNHNLFIFNFIVYILGSKLCNVKN